VRTFFWSNLKFISNTYLRLYGAKVAGSVTLVGLPIISVKKLSNIYLHDGVKIVSNSTGTALGVGRRTILRTLFEGATITIGQDSGLSGSTITCASKIIIGKRCLIGADVLIMDTDFHPVKHETRNSVNLPYPAESDRIEIGDDVFIGARSIILKGVKIGNGCVIGAGSVVTSSLPSMTISAGNPAKVLKKIN